MFEIYRNSESSEILEASEILETVLCEKEFRDRRVHSYGVSDKLQELGKVFAPDVSQKFLEDLGILHDVGYSTVFAGHHAVDGALLLEFFNVDEFSDQIAWHSTAEWELPLLGVEQFFDKPDERVRALLWAADFTTSNIGERISLSERFKNIRERYSEDSTPVVALKSSIPAMKHLFRRYGLDSDPLIDLESVI